MTISTKCFRWRCVPARSKLKWDLELTMPLQAGLTFSLSKLCCCINHLRQTSELTIHLGDTTKLSELTPTWCWRNLHITWPPTFFFCRNMTTNLFFFGQEPTLRVQKQSFYHLLVRKGDQLQQPKKNWQSCRRECLGSTRIHGTQSITSVDHMSPAQSISMMDLIHVNTGPDKYLPLPTEENETCQPTLSKEVRHSNQSPQKLTMSSKMNWNRNSPHPNSNMSFNSNLELFLELSWKPKSYRFPSFSSHFFIRVKSIHALVQLINNISVISSIYLDQNHQLSHFLLSKAALTIYNTIYLSSQLLSFYTYI